MRFHVLEFIDLHIFPLLHNNSLPHIKALVEVNKTIDHNHVLIREIII